MSRLWVLSRRELLRLATMAGFWLPSHVRGRERLRVHNVSERCRELFSDLGAAAEVGRAYLEAVHEEGEAALLVSRIEGAEGLPLGASSEALRAWLDQRIRADFAHGDTATVRGWRISRTEGRVCALVAARRSSSRSLRRCF